MFIAPQADQKFVSHLEFLSRVSKSAAERLYIAYEEVIHYIEENPTVCPVYIPQQPCDVELRYKLFGKRYRIVFEIIGNTIYAYDIQDCRQDYDKNFL